MTRVSVIGLHRHSYLIQSNKGSSTRSGQGKIKEENEESKVAAWLFTFSSAPSRTLLVARCSLLPTAYCLLFFSLCY